MRKWFLAGALMAAPAAAHGQWAIVNGTPSFTANYSFPGSFGCTQESFAPNICDPIANGVRINNGTAWADFVYTGFSGALTATNVETNPLIGTLTMTRGGVGPFTWPVPPNTQPLFALGISNAFALGFGYSDAVTLQYNCCEGYATSAIGAIPGQPPQLRYSATVLRLQGVPTFNANQSSTWEIRGRFGLVPEPSTYALTAAGLCALALAARHRRRS